MSEAGYVELPVLQWLSGHGSTTPADHGLGWTYRSEADMAEYGRPLEDPLVEKLLIAAILRINPAVKTPAQAALAVAALRRAMTQPDKLTANRETLDLLREGAIVALAPGEDARTVHFIEFDPAQQHLNDFTATNQYRVQGIKQCREDTVLLVNGIPLVVAEYKSYVSSGKDWTEAVHQLHRYQRQAPLLLAPNVFCLAADEEAFRYGTVLFDDKAGKDDIDRHLDSWGPWLSLYPDRKGYWNQPEADPPDDPLETPVKSLLRLKPCHLLDFLQHFIVFETKKGRTTKKIARYQQFEDWDKLKATVPGELERCLEGFAGIKIEDTRACLLAALGRLQGPEAARLFEQNFKSLSRLWEAVSPDPCLYPHRFSYQWLCGVYVAYRRRKSGKGKSGTFEELSAKTRKLIEENTTFLKIAEALPVFRIDEDYVGQLEELPTAADKAAALEAMLTAELVEGEPGSPVYRMLGERLQRIKERKDASDKAAEERLKELQDAADALVTLKALATRLSLAEPGEYALYTVLRDHAATQDEAYLADCARRMAAYLREHGLLMSGWGGSRGGRMRVEQSLLAESWNAFYAPLGFDPDSPEPPFLAPAVSEPAKIDG
jgi:type I site-specific restriction-modification system R (restriction) subunit